MNKSTLLLAFLLLSFSAWSQLKIYPIDSWHSTIQFTTTFGGMVDVPGTFNTFEGAIAFHDKDPLQLSTTVIIDVNSIDTNVSLRDTHLKEEGYLDAKKFPQIRFTSKSTTRKKGKHYLSGTLELRGVKKEISIPFEQTSKEKLDPWKNPRVTFVGNIKLNRKEFLIAPDNTSISEDVVINLMISARIFGMETQGLFKRPFGEIVWNKFKTAGVDAALAAAEELSIKEDADAKRSLSLNFVAMRMEEENRIEDALKVYEQNAKKFADKDAVHSNLANAYFRKNMKEKAIEASRAALKINPDNCIALEIMKVCEQTN